MGEQTESDHEYASADTGPPLSAAERIFRLIGFMVFVVVYAAGMQLPGLRTPGRGFADAIPAGIVIGVAGKAFDAYGKRRSRARAGARARRRPPGWGRPPQVG
jgi:hypothetical protein